MTAPLDIAVRYENAPDFPAYLDLVDRNRELWRGLWDRARVPEELLDAARELDGPFRLLALSEDWCGDAVNVLPPVARWVEAVDGLELRILGRDDNPDLMDAHLTNGTSRSIPVIIAYDRDFNEVGWWGPRPAALQRWVMEEGMALSKDDRYREVRRWFARDRGRTTLEELLALLQAASAVSRTS